MYDQLYLTGSETNTQGRRKMNGEGSFYLIQPFDHPNLLLLDIIGGINHLCPKAQLHKNTNHVKSSFRHFLEVVS